jgi:uncharacterized BrkB/YihY/UPF0761 family membrane protein
MFTEADRHNVYLYPVDELRKKANYLTRFMCFFVVGYGMFFGILAGVLGAVFAGNESYGMLLPVMFWAFILTLTAIVIVIEHLKHRVAKKQYALLTEDAERNGKHIRLHDLLFRYRRNSLIINTVCSAVFVLGFLLFYWIAKLNGIWAFGSAMPGTFAAIVGFSVCIGISASVLYPNVRRQIEIIEKEIDDAKSPFSG